MSESFHSSAREPARLTHLVAAEDWFARSHFSAS
jgi:hypothetical protein